MTLLDTAPVIVAHPGWLPIDGWGRPMFDVDGYRLAVLRTGDGEPFWSYVGPPFRMTSEENES